MIYLAGILASGCTLILNPGQGKGPVSSPNPFFINSLNTDFLADGIVTRIDAPNRITFTNVPAGRWHSFPLEIGGRLIPGEDNEVCNPSDLGNFAFFKNSALHVDLGVRQLSGSLEFGCSYQGWPFFVNLDFNRSEIALVSSASSLSSSLFVSVSAPTMSVTNGRYVAFVGDDQIYRKDITTGKMDLVSKNSNFGRGNGKSSEPSLSGDGRFVSFVSTSTNLVTGARGQQIYLQDMQSLQLGPVLVTSRDSTEFDQLNFRGLGQSFSPTLSGDGRFVVFASSAPNFVPGGSGQQIYFKDMQAPQQPPALISSLDSTQANQAAYQGTSSSFVPSISSDGKWVAFQSSSSNLATGAGGTQIFLKNMQSLSTPPTLISSIDSTQLDQSAYRGTNSSFSPRISGDGNFVAFHSSATNLALGASGAQVYLYARQTPQLAPSMISSQNSSAIDQSAVQGNDTSGNPRISGDGRFVLFESSATNFVTGAVDRQIYFKDMLTPQLPPTMVSTVNSTATDQSVPQGNAVSQSAAVSDDGRYMLFKSAATNLADGAIGAQLYLKDMQHSSAAPTALTGTYALAASQIAFWGDAASTTARLSRDGRFMVFATSSTNLVTGASGQQIYLKNLNDAKLALTLVTSNDSTQPDQSASRGNGPSSAAAISGDGRFVAFQSTAENFVSGASGQQVYLKDTQSPHLPPVIVSSIDSTQSNQAAFQGVSPSANPSVSNDGQYVAFESLATNLVTGGGGSQIYVKDMHTPQLPPIMVSTKDSTEANQTTFRGDADSSAPSISGDGRYVAFVSSAGNLVTGGSAQQIYLKDMDQPDWPPIMISSKNSTLVNQAPVRGGAASGAPSISRDGNFVVFESSAPNLVAGGGGRQIYIKSVLSPHLPPIMVSSLDSTQANQAASRGNATSTLPSISDDGRFVAFESVATNLVTGALLSQIYLKDMLSSDLPPIMASSIKSSELAQSSWMGDSPSIYTNLSGDGRRVIFESASTNFVQGSKSTQIYLSENPLWD